MVLTLNLVLLVASAVCFLLSVLSVPKVNWVSLGLLLFVLSFIIK